MKKKNKLHKKNLVWCAKKHCKKRLGIRGNLREQRWGKKRTLLVFFDNRNETIQTHFNIKQSSNAGNTQTDIKQSSNGNNTQTHIKQSSNARGTPVRSKRCRVLLLRAPTSATAPASPTWFPAMTNTKDR